MEGLTDVVWGCEVLSVIVSGIELTVNNLYYYNFSWFDHVYVWI